MTQTRYLVVGEVVKPHGIHGEVVVRSVTDRPELRFTPGARLLLGPDESSLEPVEVSRARPFKDGYLVTFEPAGDRGRAEVIRGWWLFTGVENLPAPAEDTYYYHQLVGIAVCDRSGAGIGRVSAIRDLGPYALLEVSRGEGENFFLPLVDEFVVEVNLEAGRLTVQLPAGLLDG